jgi:preprotein translocase subunit YajC
MKTAYLLLIISFVFSGLSYSQRDKWRNDEMKGKFEQLEKIKLIEALGMNEDTTLRFFARKSEQQKQQEEIQQKIDEKIDNLEIIFKSGRVATVDELKSNINEINTLRNELEKNRTDFINSLSDILSYDQIAKLIIFERNFRDQIRQLIMKDRKTPPIEHE